MSPRNLVGLGLASGMLYLAIVGFASIPRQIFFPASETPSDCAATLEDVKSEIATVARGGRDFSFDEKLQTQARLEGLRDHCSSASAEVKRLMRAHEHAWILEERRKAFFKSFKLATLAPTPKDSHD